MVLTISVQYLRELWEVLLYKKSIAENYLFETANAIVKPVDVVVARMGTISTKYWEAIFYSLLLLYTGILLVQAWSYSHDAQLFPVLIGVPLVAMSVLYIGTMFSSRFSGGSGGLFDSISDETMQDAQSDEDSTGIVDPIAKLQREVKMALWTVAVLILVYTIGFLNALALFIFSFLYINEQELLRAAVITVLSIVFIEIFFINILSLSLWEGVVFSSVALLRPVQTGCDE